MNNPAETYRFMVLVWLQGVESNAPWDKPRWSEMCLCLTRQRAVDIAEALAAVQAYTDFQVAEFNGDKYVGFKFIPESARHLK